MLRVTEGTQVSYTWKEVNDHAIKRSMGGVVLSAERRNVRENWIWLSRSSAKSRKAVAIKSLKEKWKKREQLAKVNGEKKIGGSSTVTKIDGRMDGDLYLQILKDELQQTMEYYGFNPPDTIFQQDNDPKHTCKKVKEWLEEQDFITMVWPAQSVMHSVPKSS